MARKIKIDNAILKRRQYQKPQRKTKTVICRILIVCEGEKTEPNYFKSFDKIQRGVIVYDVEAHGKGENTIDVVNRAIYERDMAEGKGRPYDCVWAVFDRDSFPAEKFDNAIHKAVANNIDCAWSNEAFELWYLLHFQYRNAAMKRDDYKKAISYAVNNSPINKQKKNDYVYSKNAIDNYTTMNLFGNQGDAIKWAQELHNNCTGEKYHSHNPCTLVYRLVLQLMGKDEELNSKLISKIED